VAVRDRFGCVALYGIREERFLAGFVPQGSRHPVLPRCGVRFGLRTSRTACSMTRAARNWWAERDCTEHLHHVATAKFSLRPPSSASGCLARSTRSLHNLCRSHASLVPRVWQTSMHRSIAGPRAARGTAYT